MKTENIVYVNNLRFSYPQKNDVLKDVSFKIKRGEHIGLIGPNGSGKTTLFLLLCGILKPQAGNIMVNSKPIVHAKFNPQVSYLFQSPDDQLFSASVFDDVAFGPLNMGLCAAEVKIRVEKAIFNVGLSHLAKRAPHHLSGGEKRMAAIATLLAMMPEVILFDEPTSNLDSLNRRNVINLIQKIESTLIIASHDLEFLLETCSKVMLLNQGTIVRTGPIKKIMADQSLMHTHHLEKPHSLIPHKHRLLK